MYTDSTWKIYATFTRLQPCWTIFLLCPNVLRQKPNTIISPQNFAPPPHNSALSHAFGILFKYVHIENIYYLFLGLIGVGRPNQKVLLGFYSFCPLSVFSWWYEGIQASDYLQILREKWEVGLYNHNCLPQTMKFDINNET